MLRASICVVFLATGAMASALDGNTAVLHFAVAPRVPGFPDGVASNALVEAHPSLDVGADFSIGFWVWLSRQTYSQIVSRTGSANEPLFRIHSDEDGGLVFAQSPGTQPGREIGIGTGFTTRQWHHVFGVRSGSSLRLYLDGQRVASGPAGGAPLPSSEPLRIAIVEGSLSDLQLWNRALSDDEVRALMASSPRGDEAGLVAYWPLTDGAGETARNVVNSAAPLILGENTRASLGDPGWLPAWAVPQMPYYRIHAFDAAIKGTDGALFDLDDDGDLDYLRWGAMYDETIPEPPFYAQAKYPVHVYRNHGGFDFRYVAGAVDPPDAQLLSGVNGMTADFDGDGRDDVLVIDQGPDQDVDPNPDKLVVPGGINKLLLQTAGGGMLERYREYAENRRVFTHRGTIGDVDGDGDIDFFLGAVWSTDALDEKGDMTCVGEGTKIEAPCSALYLNDGRGRFTKSRDGLPPGLYNFDEGPFIEAGRSQLIDVDEDGDLDLYCPQIGYEGGDRVRDQILLNDGSGQFTVADPSLLPERSGGIETAGYWAVPIDLDGDPTTDLVIGLEGWRHEQPSNIPLLQFLVGTGNGRFRNEAIPQPPYFVTTDRSAGRVVVADLNGDRRDDIIIGHPLHTTMIYWRTLRGFEAWSGVFPPNSNIAGAGDIDGDGDIDLIYERSTNFYVFETIKPFREPLPPKRRAARK